MLTDYRNFRPILDVARRVLVTVIRICGRMATRWRARRKNPSLASPEKFFRGSGLGPAIPVLDYPSHLSDWKGAQKKSYPDFRVLAVGSVINNNNINKRIYCNSL